MESVDLKRMWESIHGNDNALVEKALEVFQDVGNRILISGMCCELDSDGFEEIVKQKVSTECKCALSVAELIASELVNSDRRFKDVVTSLDALIVDSGPYSVCGVEVDEAFIENFMEAIEYSVHIKSVDKVEMRNKFFTEEMLSECFTLLKASKSVSSDAYSSQTALNTVLKKLKQLDPDLRCGAASFTSLNKHAYRLAHRLWYDTGLLCPTIETTLKKLCCRVAHSMANYKAYAPILEVHLDAATNLVMSLDSCNVLTDEFLYAATATQIAVTRIFESAQMIGADVGMMLSLFEYDNSYLHLNMSEVKETISCLDDGVLEVVANAITKNNVNKFGSNIGVRNNGMSTVADPSVTPKTGIALFDADADIDDVNVDEDGQSNFDTIF